MDDKIWTKTCHFELQSHVPLASTNRYNIMYQGWLFKDIPNDPNRLGSSLFPLCGVYTPYGLMHYNDDIRMDNNDDILHYAGYNNLHWGDQHCHLDFGAWHFGSDMSKIIVDPSCSLIKFWCVCVDTENKKVDVSLVYIVGDIHTNNVEGMLRNCNPQLSMAKAKEFYQLFTAVFMDEIDKMAKDTKRNLSQLLFGVDIDADADADDSDGMKEKLQDDNKDADGAEIAGFSGEIY